MKEKNLKYDLISKIVIPENLVEKVSEETKISQKNDVIISKHFIDEDTTLNDELLENTLFMRSDEGIEKTVEYEDKILENKDAENNNDDRNENTADEYNDNHTNEDYTYEDDNTIYNTYEETEILLDISKSEDENKTIDLINTIEEKVSKPEESYDLLEKIRQISDILVNGSESYENISHLFLELAIINMFLLLLFMLIVGILATIKYLWNEAQINLLSKLKDILIYYKLEKVLYYIKLLKISKIVLYVLEKLNRAVELYYYVLDLLEKIEQAVKTWNYLLDLLDKIEQAVRIWNAYKWLKKKIKDFNLNIKKLNNIPFFNPNITVYMNNYIEYNQEPIELTSENLLDETDNRHEHADFKYDHPFILFWRIITAQPYYNVMRITLGINACIGRTTIKGVYDLKNVKKENYMFMVKELLNHYFNNGYVQNTFWMVIPKIDSFFDHQIKCARGSEYLEKISVFISVQGKLNFNGMIQKLIEENTFPIENRGQLDYSTITREINFANGSKFVLLFRGTMVAFLEVYPYNLSSIGVEGMLNIIPLTVPVGEGGMENPVLKDIMDRYRDLCIEGIIFPYTTYSLTTNLKTKYVFDLVEHSEACHLLFQYISSESPRIHKKYEGD